MSNDTLATLFRPVGQKELDLIRKSDWKQFPPRLAWQPIFYPVLIEDYAIRIARDWNTKDPNSGYVGYVLRFQSRRGFLDKYTVQTVGARTEQEYWIPAEELESFNSNIVGLIEVTQEFHGSGQT